MIGWRHALHAPSSSSFVLHLFFRVSFHFGFYSLLPSFLAPFLLSVHAFFFPSFPYPPSLFLLFDFLFTFSMPTSFSSLAVSSIFPILPSFLVSFSYFSFLSSLPLTLLVLSISFPYSPSLTHFPLIHSPSLPFPSLPFPSLPSHSIPPSLPPSYKPFLKPCEYTCPLCT